MEASSDPVAPSPLPMFATNTGSTSPFAANWTKPTPLRSTAGRLEGRQEHAGRPGPSVHRLGAHDLARSSSETLGLAEWTVRRGLAADPLNVDLAIEYAELAVARGYGSVGLLGGLRSGRQALKQIGGELRQGIVARAHDDDAVAGASEGDQLVAAAVAIGMGEGLALPELDGAD